MKLPTYKPYISRCYYPSGKKTFIVWDCAMYFAAEYSTQKEAKEHLRQKYQKPQGAKSNATA